MIKAVIFDFDGTLADTNEVIIKSFQSIYRKYYNRECEREYIINTFGETLRFTIERDFAEYDTDEVLDNYRRYQITRFEEEVALYDTVKETLEELKNMHLKMGIVTSRMRRSTEDALSRFDVLKYFETIVSADDMSYHKPHPKPLQEAMRQLATKPLETLYVGDTRFDVECALNAGVTPVLAGWQQNSEELVKTYNIGHVLKEMSEIIKIIATIK